MSRNKFKIEYSLKVGDNLKHASLCKSNKKWKLFFKCFWLSLFSKSFKLTIMRFDRLYIRIKPYKMKKVPIHFK